MGLVDWIQKTIKPVGGGNSFFEAYGVPPVANLTDQINSYNGVVYACVSAIAEEVGKITIETKKGDKEVSSPFLELLKNPNSEQRITQYNLFELTQTYIELAGECFWYMAKGEVSNMPKQIFILRPDQMNVAIGKNGAIIGYTFTKDDGNKVPFEIDEIVHFKMPNPRNPYRGMGTVAASMVYIQTERYSSEWTRNSFYNDASPRGIVSLKGVIKDTEFESLKRRWNKEYAGIKNANKTAILKGVDIDYTKIGASIDEIAVKELRGMSRDDIMFMFRVSKPILGIVEDVNLANGRAAMYAFMQRVIRPKMERIVDTLQSSLGELYQVDISFVDPVEEDDMEKASYYEKLLNVGLTINDIREELGKDPIEGGDSIYQPINLLSLGAPIAKPSAVKITRTKKTIIKEKHKSIPEVGNKLDKNYLHWKSMNSIERTWSKRYSTAVDKVLDIQKKDVISKLKPKRKKDVTGYEPDKKKYEELWLLTLLPITLALFKEMGDYSASIIGTEFSTSKTAEQNLADRITKTFTDFDAQTSEKLTKTILEGMTSEESLADLADRVGDVYTEAKGYRAERIARTEVHKTANDGSLQAYKDSKYVTGKQWYANPGACGFCAEMDGKIVDLDTNFLEMGASVDYTDENDVVQTMGIDYEPIGTGDLHPNCECTQLPWSADYEETGKFGGQD